ncbi:hypothetical protein E4U42_007060 [Claviceps africana]|uniref:Neprosin domain-containing protein n=1 Tax=Claviceps africana TaxID=83212 RepID=A0A8K0NGD0_9HYPO|nr:hypothetical protein E4U42_007060 [Claviceps africana]
MQLKQLLAWPCLLSGFMATANPILARGLGVPHDSIAPLPESLPDNVVGRNMKKFQPRFNTEGEGCWPYPAVDSKGDYSGGLKPSGPEGGDCNNSVGQVYIRAATYKGHHAFMYAWFLPKNQNGAGDGHRYDWQCAIVWVDEPESPDAKIQAVSTSHYETYETRTDLSTISFDGTHPLLGYWYSQEWDNGLHYLGFTTVTGGLHPAVEWSMLNQLERTALYTTDWSNVMFPLGYYRDVFLQRAYPF